MPDQHWKVIAAWAEMEAHPPAGALPGRIYRVLLQHSTGELRLGFLGPSELNPNLKLLHPVADAVHLQVLASATVAFHDAQAQREHNTILAECVTLEVDGFPAWRPSDGLTVGHVYRVSVPSRPHRPTTECTILCNDNGEEQRALWGHFKVDT